MFTSVLDLAQVANLMMAATITNTTDLGPGIVHTGMHRDVGNLVLTQCDQWGILVSAKPYAYPSLLDLIR